MPSYPTRDVPFLCLVGASAASFWRGAWYAMDALLFPDDLPLSCAASLSLGFGGFATLHSALPHLRSAPPFARGLALYCAALGNVFAWRGVWLGWDLLTGTGAAAILPPGPQLAPEEERKARQEHLRGALASHFTATALLFGLRHMTSTLAPPARIGVLSDTQSYAAIPRMKGHFLPDVGMFINPKALPRQWKMRR